MIFVGSVAMLMGAVDPLEGSVVILIGSALLALGTFLSQSERRFLSYRLLVFILIALGVGAMWGLTAGGGLGGSSGRSLWWGILILPYLVGWSMGIWGPGNQRWVWWLGMVVGLWYLTLGGMVLLHSSKPGSPGIVIVLGLIGATTIGGCLVRLRNRPSPSASP
jgi:hypothetical protein